MCVMILVTVAFITDKVETLLAILDEKMSISRIIVVSVENIVIDDIKMCITEF